MTIPTNIPEPLNGRYIRLHSGGKIGICTGMILRDSGRVRVQVRWPGIMTHEWLDVRDLVWLSTIADLG